jgi:Xaa-Pro aminopeptidase
MSTVERKELWKQCPVPVLELKRERYDRLYPMMDAEHLDALVVLAAGGLGRKGNLRYITNFGPVSRYAGVVFPRRGEPVLFVAFPVHLTWAESMTWVEEVRFSGDWPKDLAAVLQDRGLSRGQIGLVGQENLPGLETALAERLPHAHFSSAATLLANLRMVKTPLEVQLARTAAAISDAAFSETASLVAQGATEIEIFAATEARLRRLNAEEWLLLLGTTGAPVLPFPSHRAVAVGDLVQYSVEPVSPGGIWIQNVRMFSRGEPTPRSRQITQVFLDALSGATSAIKPGAPLRKAAQAMAEILRPLAPPGKAPYGHGIGMDNFELPPLSVETKVVAEANMLVVIHPELEVDGQCYYLGDTHVITERGAERLSRYPLELIVV